MAAYITRMVHSWKRQHGQVSKGHVAFCRGPRVWGRKDVLCCCCPLCWFWQWSLFCCARLLLTSVDVQHGASPAPQWWTKLLGFEVLINSSQRPKYETRSLSFSSNRTPLHYFRGHCDTWRVPSDLFIILSAVRSHLLLAFYSVIGESKCYYCNVSTYMSIYIVPYVYPSIWSIQNMALLVFQPKENSLFETLYCVISSVEDVHCFVVLIFWEVM